VPRLRSLQPALSPFAHRSGRWAVSIASYGSLMPCSSRGDGAANLKRKGATYAVVWQRWSGCGPEAPDWSAQPWSGP